MYLHPNFSTLVSELTLNLSHMGSVLFHIQEEVLRIPITELSPVVGCFHNICLDHHYMVFSTHFLHNFAFKRAKLLKSGYATKGNNTPLDHLNPTQSIRVFTHIGLHVMFFDPIPGSNRCMHPPQEYLTRTNLGWNDRGVYCLQTH